MAALSVLAVASSSAPVVFFFVLAATPRQINNFSANSLGNSLQLNPAYMPSEDF
jgi:hypothetical protein